MEPREEQNMYRMFYYATSVPVCPRVRSDRMRWKTPKLTETFTLAYFSHFAPRSNAAKQRRTSANLTSE
jgi:hypothetical protein